MLSEICAEIRNYFCKDEDKHFGNFTIDGGSISDVDFLQEGQFFRVSGSVFNDGVWRYPATDMIDETFSGSVWAMRVPPSLVALSEQIEDWNEKYGEAVYSPFQSESVGSYSYTKSAGKENGGASADWRNAFAGQLNKWRRIHV